MSSPAQGVSKSVNPQGRSDPLEHIDGVVAELSNDPPGGASPEVVRAEVVRAFEDLSPARVSDFVPILARRRARASLRDWSDKRLDGLRG
jgi:hypothetical protein